MGGIVEASKSKGIIKAFYEQIVSNEQMEEKPLYETTSFDVIMNKKEKKEQKQIHKFQETLRKSYKCILNDHVLDAIGLLEILIEENEFLNLYEFRGIGNQQSWNGYFKDGPVSWLKAQKKKNQQQQFNPYDLISICFYLLIYKNDRQYFDQFVEWYDKELQKRQSLQLWIGIGNLYYNQKDYKRAETFYTKALEMNQSFAKTYEYLAWVYGYWFDYDSLANTYAAKSLEINPDSITCQYIFALTQQNSLKRKILLQQIIRENPDYYRVYINIGEIESSRQKSKQFYQKCLYFDDRYKFAYLKLGDLERFAERYASAQQYYLKAKQIDELEDYVYFYLGCLSEDQGDYDEALVLYKMCLEINKDNADICATISNLYRNMGQSDKAIEYMLKQIEQNPYDFQNCNLLGIYYDEEEQNELAQQYFRKALQINSQYYEPYVNLGSSSQEKKKFEEAIKFYQKACELKPNEVDPYFGMAICQANLHNHEKGIQWCMKCIDLGCDEDKQVYEILGDIYKDMKEYQQSLHTYLLYDMQTQILHTDYIESNLFCLIDRKKIASLLWKEFDSPQFDQITEFFYAEIGKLSLAISQQILAKRCFEKLQLISSLNKLHTNVDEELKRYKGTSEHIINNYHLGVRSYENKIQLLALKRQFEQHFSRIYKQFK